MKRIIYILLIVSVQTFGQKKDSIPNFDGEYFMDQVGDTLTIALDEVSVFPKHKFKSLTDKNYYNWFRKKVFKAYPYAIMASKKIDSLNVITSKIESKRKKRKYVKKVQKYVEEEFTDQLKKLTRTEGRVLLKLIHRQTGKTAYQNIKEVRSGFKAFIYNAQANLFSISLKEEYKPNSENESYLIEDIIQRAFIDDLLEPQDSRLNFDAHQIIAKKKGEVDVEKYKKMFSKKKKRKKKK